MNALNNNNEENKKNLLFKDTIELFTIKKGFSFLVELFVEIYKNKDLCELLLVKFNVNQKDIEKILDREPFLEKHKSIFNTIISETNNYNYDEIEFYGILLCYLHFYDYEIFVNLLMIYLKINQKSYSKFCLFIILISNLIQLTKF